MEQNLPMHAEPTVYRVGIGIAREQNGLEKEQACPPDGSRATKPRENLLRNQRLNKEQQESREEDDQRVRHKLWGTGLALVGAR